MSKKNFQQAKQKAILIEQLKRTPIVEVAVSKVDISRATYYVWRKNDAEFAKTADQAISEGVLYINDLSESQLIGLIKDKDVQSIRFWLTHRHPAYAAKLQVEANLHNEDGALTPEQQKVVNQALRMLSISEGMPGPAEGKHNHETDAGHNKADEPGQGNPQGNN